MNDGDGDEGSCSPPAAGHDVPPGGDRHHHPGSLILTLRVTLHTVRHLRRRPRPAEVADR